MEIKKNHSSKDEFDIVSVDMSEDMIYKAKEIVRNLPI